MEQICNTVGKDSVYTSCEAFLRAKNSQTANPSSDKKCVEISCYLLLSNGLHELALNYLKWLEDHSLTDLDRMQWKILLSDSLNRIFHHKQSMEQLLEVFRTTNNTFHEKSVSDAKGNFSQTNTNKTSNKRKLLEVVSHAYKILADTCRHLKYFAQSEALVSYSVKLIEQMKTADENFELEIVCHNSLASVYYEQQKYEQAHEQQSFCLEKLISRHGKHASHPDLSRCYRNMAKILCSMWKYEESLNYCEMSQAVLQDFYHADELHSNLELAQCFEEQGSVYFQMENFNESLKFYSKAKIIRRIALSQTPNDPRIAHSLHNIGKVYQKQKQWQKALKCFDDAMNLLEKNDLTSSESYPLFAEILLSKSMLNLETQHIFAAIEFGTNSVIMLAACHNDTQKLMESISSEAVGLEEAMGQMNDRLKLELQSLNLARFLAGENIYETNVALCRSSIGDVHLESGNIAKAIEYYSQSLYILERIYGKLGNRQVAETHEKLGVAELKQKQTRNAHKHFRVALKILKQIYGKNGCHPDLAIIYMKIGFTYMEENIDNLVIENFDESLRVLKKFYGNSDRNVESAEVFAYFGAFFFRKAEYEKCLKNYLEALATIKNCYTEENQHHGIASLYGNIGEAYIHIGDSVNALRNCKKSLDIFQNIYGTSSKNTNVAEAFMRCGEACQSNGEHQNALSHYEAALEILENVDNETKQERCIADAYRHIGDLNVAMGKFDDALKSYNNELER
ncbi:hypothetical protein EB796_008483 [Bugula neritina]|uniref:Uncharacterized protein n=1 Tax=Bugula neritina TaxID=10212 RepID=A0A7J7K5P8_BUGNE|nr:hypothetical protein EB796_008483 [Bugula neritina]